MTRTQISIGSKLKVCIGGIGWFDSEVLHFEALGCPETINYLLVVDGMCYCNALLHGDHFFSNDIREIGQGWGKAANVKEAAEMFGFSEKYFK